MPNVTFLRIATALLCVCSAARAYASSDPRPEAADPREFVEFEKIWNEAHLKGDAAALEQICRDDLQVIVPKMPVMTRSEIVGFVRSGRLKFERYTTRNLNVRRHGDIVVVSGEMQRSRKMPDGQVVDDEWHFTKVYSHAAGHWQVVIFQATAAPVT